MLEKMPKHKGGRPAENPSQDVTGFPVSYDELGIKRQLAQRWQAEARQRQKEAGKHGKQGGRGNKKTLGTKMSQGFQSYERRTDTQLARASGEEKPWGKDVPRFPKKKTFRLH